MPRKGNNNQFGMKKIILTILFIGFFADYSFVPSWGVSFSGAGFSLVAVVIAALERNLSEAVLWALLAGLLLDYVSRFPLGTNVFLLVLLVLTIDLFRKKIFSGKVSPGAVFGLLLGSFFLYDFLGAVISNIFIFAEGGDRGFFPISAALQWKVFFAKFLAAGAGLFFLALYRKIKKIWGFEKMEIKI